MNSSAFSWGESGRDAQPLGGGLVSWAEFGSLSRWMSLKTARPQYCGAPPSEGASAFTGVSKDR